MKLYDIFEKPVDRPIEGVIKVDDESRLQIEVEEYVLTKQAKGHLNNFLEAYLESKLANGVWVSGFFGSGKSHFLKMLSYLLENHLINGTFMLDYFLPKCESDEFLKGNLKRAVAIPSKSILFNIDQKSDQLAGVDHDAILTVFLKVFNELCGYFGKWGYLAQFERDLDKQGKYEDFQNEYKNITGKNWKEDRPLALAKQSQISQTYAKVTNSDQNHVENIVKFYRENFKLSIEEFANLVKEYIDQQEPNFRLNFFVDEVGQYIAGNTQLMLNLQSIAESLYTKCEGRAWVLVTSQQDMDTIIGDLKAQQKFDFARIQDRFKIRLQLTGANVDEVISTRLLKKNSSSEDKLSDIYEQQHNNFGTFFDFTSGRTYKTYRTEQQFINLYPFVPYQFELFQQALINLSAHNAFTGKYASIGERSMLGVFQDVVVSIKDSQLGTLATFDRMFEGIRAVIRAQVQHQIQIAENNLDDQFALRVLKALFLVKYIKDFKATIHNIRVLMTESFDSNIAELIKKLDNALAFLEQQTYIQRNGDEYEFLTDVEKDVEEEIKQTEVESTEVSDEIKKIIFDGLIKTTKLHHDASNLDFDFTKKVDNKAYGRDYELTVQITSPEHEHVGNPTAFISMTMGLPLLIIALPAEKRIIQDLYLYRKTERYIQQATTTNQTETIQKIISDKRSQNDRRYRNLTHDLQTLISHASFYVNGTKLEITSQEPKTRILLAFDELITRVYPNLSMLRGVFYQESEIWSFLNKPQEDLFDQSAYENAEAQLEISNYIKRIYQEQHRVTFANLVNNFTRKPYGWSLAAIQCLVALLHNRGKLEIKSDSNPLEGRALLEAIKNTHGHNNLILQPQIDFTAIQIRTLKDFYQDFFDNPPASTDARSLGQETKNAFQALAEEIKILQRGQSHYRFLSSLSEPFSKVDNLSKKPYSYFFTELIPEVEELLEMKELIISPIRRFMTGDMKNTYDVVIKFLERESANFDSTNTLKATSLQQLIDDPKCFVGNKMSQARSLMNEIHDEINERLERERAEAKTKISERKQALKEYDLYKILKPDQKSKIMETAEKYEADVETITVIASVRDHRRRFEEETIPYLISTIDQMIKSGQDKPEGGDIPVDKPGQTPVPSVISISKIRANCNLQLIENEDDIDEYLSDLKKSLLEAIHNGKRISL
jgi:hypothetical protein